MNASTISIIAKTQCVNHFFCDYAGDIETGPWAFAGLVDFFDTLTGHEWETNYGELVSDRIDDENINDNVPTEVDEPFEDYSAEVLWNRIRAMHNGLLRYHVEAGTLTQSDADAFIL